MFDASLSRIDKETDEEIEGERNKENISFIDILYS